MPADSPLDAPAPRTDRLLPAAFALAWLAALAPIWLPRFLPLLDQPNHLAGIAIWHHLGDPSWRYSDYYQYSRLPVPYWGYYFPVHALAWLLPLEAANKVYLSLYAAALPLSVAAFARRFGHSPWLALLTFPLIFNYDFAFGFISYCAGLPFVLFALLSLDRFLESPSLARGATLFLLTVITFFMHVFCWMIFGVIAVPILLSRLRSWRAGLVASSLLLSTVVLAAFDFRFAAKNHLLVRAGRVAVDGRWERPIDSLMELPNRLVATWPDGSLDEMALLLLALAWLLLATTAPSLFGTNKEKGEDLLPTIQLALRDYIPELCFLLCAIGYVTLPFRTFHPLDWWNINPRLLAPAALFGALMIRGPILGKRRLLLVPALAASLIYPIALCHQYRAFNDRARGFVHLMDRVPRGSSTLAILLGNNSDPSIDAEIVPFTEFHSYAQMLGGGFNPFQLDIGFPFKALPEKRLPAPFWNRPYQFDQARHGAFYDYVLTRNEPTDGAVFRQYATRVPLIAKEGDWRLYATKGIR